MTEPRVPHASSTAWLVRRAVLALALMVGFYSLALLIAGALLAVPIAEIWF
jgi:hypothetical protein